MRKKETWREASFWVCVAVFFGKNLCVEKLHDCTKDLKAHGIKPPKYPKKRMPAAVAAARALKW